MKFVERLFNTTENPLIQTTNDVKERERGRDKREREIYREGYEGREKGEERKIEKKQTNKITALTSEQT